jgi:biotin transport system substrate-specific component
MRVLSASVSDRPFNQDIALRLGGRTALIAGTGCFALLTWAGARVSVPLPFTPVPLSLQTLAVLLSGALLGARAGAASQATYLALGFMGVPVFALPGSGPGYFLGPTGGYLAGFVLASFVTGLAMRRLRPLGAIGTSLAFLAGSVALYACGLAWLTLSLGGDVGGALSAGFFPFIPSDLAKIAMATGIHAGWTRLGRGMTGRWGKASSLL